MTWVLLSFPVSLILCPHTHSWAPHRKLYHLCIPVSSTFALIIHVFDFRSKDMLSQRHLPELCAVRLALRSQLGSD